MLRREVCLFDLGGEESKPDQTVVACFTGIKIRSLVRMSSSKSTTIDGRVFVPITEQEQKQDREFAE